MVSSVGSARRRLASSPSTRIGGPAGGQVADIKVHVMYLDISQVMDDDLGHRPRACCHNPLPVPHGVIECIPCGFQEFERLFQVGAELRRRAARAGICGQVWVVPIGVEPADLARGRTPEEKDMGFGLVGEVRDDVPT